MDIVLLNAIINSINWTIKIYFINLKVILRIIIIEYVTVISQSIIHLLIS
jgi:hypothetical protein